MAVEAAVPGRRVTRLAKLLADVGWWFVIVGAALALLLLALWPVLTGEDVDPTTSVHVEISDEAAQRLLPLMSPDTSFASAPVLKDIEGTLKFETSEAWPFLLAAGVVLPGLAAVLFGLHLARSFLRDVLDARVFTAKNARRLSWFGWLLIAAGIVLPLLEFVYTAFLVRQIGVTGVPLRVGFGTSGTVIPGILVLVVAAAWRYGVELQQEHDLTV